MTLEADGAESTLELPLVTPPSNTTVTADGGSVSLAVGDVGLPSPQAAATITLPQMPQGVIVNVAGSGTFTDGTTLDLPQGDTVNLTGGTFTGGMTFNVAQDATINLGGIDSTSGPQELVVSGSLTGSGTGTVTLSSGILVVGIGGAALDFAGSMFQWTGGLINGAGGSPDQ